MSSFHSRAAWAARLLYLALLLTHFLHAADQGAFCNGNVYGSPISPQCVSTLARFPIHDTTVHYFVEQQMRTAPPKAVWDKVIDPRPPNEKQSIVQLPKRVSYGMSISTR